MPSPIELTALTPNNDPLIVQDDDVILTADNTSAPAPRLDTVNALVGALRSRMVDMSATAPINTVPRFDGTVTNKIKASAATVADDGTLAAPGVRTDVGVSLKKQAPAAVTPVGYTRIFADAAGRIGTKDDSGAVSYFDASGIAEWNAITDYAVDKIVTRGGALWVCRMPNGPGSTILDPTTDLTNTVWAPVVQEDVAPYLEAIGRIRDGVTPAPVPGTTSINVSSGTLHFPGPDQKTKLVLAAQLPVTFTHYVRTGAPVGVATTLLNPAQYDLAGVATAIPANQFTAHRLYVSPTGVFKMLLGQTLYTSLANAKDGLSSENVALPLAFADHMLCGIVVARNNATDLASATTSSIYQVSRFGDVLAGAGSATPVINDQTTGGTTAAGSAEQVKLLAQAIGHTPSAIHMGTFTGTTIPDNVAIKPALQALETAIESGLSSAGDIPWVSGMATVAGKRYFDPFIKVGFLALTALASSTVRPSEDPTNFEGDDIHEIGKQVSFMRAGDFGGYVARTATKRSLSRTKYVRMFNAVSIKSAEAAMSAGSNRLRLNEAVPGLYVGMPVSFPGLPAGTVLTSLQTPGNITVNGGTDGSSNLFFAKGGQALLGFTVATQTYELEEGPTSPGYAGNCTITGLAEPDMTFTGISSVSGSNRLTFNGPIAWGARVPGTYIWHPALSTLGGNARVTGFVNGVSVPQSRVNTADTLVFMGMTGTLAQATAGKTFEFGGVTSTVSSAATRRSDNQIVPGTFGTQSGSSNLFFPVGYVVPPNDNGIGIFQSSRRVSGTNIAANSEITTAALVAEATSTQSTRTGLASLQGEPGDTAIVAGSFISGLGVAAGARVTSVSAGVSVNANITNVSFPTASGSMPANTYGINQSVGAGNRFADFASAGLNIADLVNRRLRGSGWAAGISARVKRAYRTDKNASRFSGEFDMHAGGAWAQLRADGETNIGFPHAQFGGGIIQDVTSVGDSSGGTFAPGSAVHWEGTSQGFLLTGLVHSGFTGAAMTPFANAAIGANFQANFSSPVVRGMVVTADNGSRVAIVLTNGQNGVTCRCSNGGWIGGDIYTINVGPVYSTNAGGNSSLVYGNGITRVTPLDHITLDTPDGGTIVNSAGTGTLTTGTLSTVSSAAPTTNVTKGSLTVGARRPISVAATATGTLTDLRVGAVFDANDPFGFTSSGTLNMGGTIDVSENATATQVAAIVVGAIWQTDVAATSPTAIVSGAHPYTLNGICTTSANNVTGNDDAEAVFLPYGAADSATFYLPEAVPNEVDHEPGEHASGVTRITGQRYGSRTVSLTAAQLPPHNHTMDHAHSATASRIRGANAANTNATSGTSFSFAMQTSAGGAFDTSEGGMTDSIDISVATHSGSTGSGPGTSSPIVVEPPSIASIAVGGKKIYVGAAP